MSGRLEVNRFKVGELVEDIDRINQLLLRHYGEDLTGRPNWRVVWSDTQTEKRWMDHTDEGFHLINPEVRLVKKYQYIKEKYILERLVPVVGETDVVAQFSYEPAWTFEDRHGKYLPPLFDACKTVIELILHNIANKGLKKAVDDPNTDPEKKQKMLDDVEFELFGNETPVGDALAHGYGVAGFHPKEEKQ